MRRALAKFPLVVLAVSLVLSLAAPAFAAEKPVAWEIVDVTLHSEGTSSVLLISGKLPDSVKLPATVQLSAPAGSQLQWAGEIIGEDPSKDPEVKPEVTTGEVSDVYTFTLTQARLGQIEVIHPEVLRFDGTGYAANIAWTPPTDVGELRLNVLIPANGQVGQLAEGLKAEPAPNGQSYVRKSITEAKAGEPVDLAVNYTLVAPQTGTAASGGSSNVAFILIAILFGAFAVVAFMAVRGKTRARATDAEGEYAADEEDADASEAAVVPGADTVVSTSVDDEEDGEPGAPVRRKNMLVPVVVIAALVFAGAYAVSAGSKGVSQGGVISMTFATGDACTESAFALQAPGGRDLSKDANDVLGTLRSVAGVNYANLDVAASSISVGYCDSSASADQILAALQASGYGVTPTGTGPAGAPPAEAPAAQ